MLKKVILAENALDKSTWETFEVPSVREFLYSRFDALPDTARIYHNQVAESNEIYFHDDPEGKKLDDLSGTFYVVVYPGGAAIPYIIYAVIAIASYYYAKSQIPSATARNVQNQSPNNELSERTNKARPRARIPDLYGTVRSTPDLLSLHTAYVDHVEKEYMYTCVGRGAHEIPANEVKDETTLYSEIEGSGVEIYAPNTSPNSGDSPQLTIGDQITEAIYIANRSNAINGQVLKSANIGESFQGDGDTMFGFNTTWSGSPFLAGGSFQILGPVDFGDLFNVGDEIVISNAVYDDDVTFVNLDGTYTILYIAVGRDPQGTPVQTIVQLEDVVSITTDWELMPNFLNGITGPISPLIESASDGYVGPFRVKAPDLEKVYCNFVALNGLYRDDGVTQTAINIEVEVSLTPIDSQGVPSGAEILTRGVVIGSATEKSSRALTLKISFGTQTTGYEGAFSIKARRITDKITANGTVMDEIKWRDVYAMGEVTQNDFGDVTTVHSVTQATGGALVAKSRKLNMLATRKLPRRISGSTFTVELYPTDRADEIISAMCLDPRIGNRSKDEVDFDNIYDTVAEIETYFGIEKAVEFGYTFDSDNLSFEEMISSVVQAIYCTAYRFGSVIRINFEKETDDSVLLFNHRNKLPGSEKRSVRFGNQDDQDGVELEYVDPEDDAVVTIYLPNDQARNPKKVETIGVRNRIQAYWLAWRLWNKIQLQNTATEFNATQEADLLVLNDRILVADNTRPGTQDGDVISQDGLELTLSQAVVFDVAQTYIIFLQHTDGSVESIGVTAGSTSRQVLLAQAPKAPLSLDVAAYARATYQIVGSASTREQAFLVTEKDTLDNFTSRVVAINYDDEYYEHDSWYADGIINEEGEFNVAGTISFSPLPEALVYLSSSFPVAVTVNQTNPGDEIRYSKTAMPTNITDGAEYTGPVDVNDGETLYARPFSPINDGVGISGTYNSVPNLDFQFATNSQYLATM